MPPMRSHVSFSWAGHRSDPRMMPRGGESGGWPPLIVGAWISVLSLGGSAQQAAFIPLADRSGVSVVSRVGNDAISSDGSIIVGVATSTTFGMQEATRWTESTGMILLGKLPGGAYSSASSVSLDGTVMVGSGNSSSHPNGEPCIWSGSGNPIGLGVLPGATYGSGISISSDGLVAIGSCQSPGQLEAYRWTASTGMLGMGSLPGLPVNSAAIALSSDGSVIVGYGYTPSWNPLPWRWTAATGIVAIPLVPGAVHGVARDVSADGSVVVGGYGGAQSEAFRWTATTGMVGLGDLPGGPFVSIANGVSDSGLVIVGQGRNIIEEAVFWGPTGTGPISITDYLSALGVTAHTGWHLKSAEAVSADGLRIVGNGRNPTGQEQAWLVILPTPWNSDCNAKLNSLGCTPSISGTGVPSASNAWTFELRTTRLLNQKAGLYFYKVGGGFVSVPFQGGTLCVGPSGIRRTPVLNSGGTQLPAQDCTGVLRMDFNAFAHGQLGGSPDPALLSMGTIYRVQAWGRDQGFAAPNNTSLSNALEVPIGP